MALQQANIERGIAEVGASFPVVDRALSETEHQPLGRHRYR
jgi:hypothetical protein